MNCSDFLLCIWLFIMIIGIASRDEDGMDEYDRCWGIADGGKTRGMFGAIYKDGDYDIWSNLLDHNPYRSY